MEKTIKPGDQLYKVHNDHRMRSRDGHVTVKSAGAKWITTTDGQRFNTSDLRGDNTHSRLYLSKEIWDAEVARQNAWDRLRKLVERFSPPEALSTEDMKQAIALLTVKKQEASDA